MYKNLTIEIQLMWRMKPRIISDIIGATIAISRNAAIATIINDNPFLTHFDTKPEYIRYHYHVSVTQSQFLMGSESKKVWIFVKESSSFNSRYRQNEHGGVGSFNYPLNPSDRVFNQLDRAAVLSIIYGIFHLSDDSTG